MLSILCTFPFLFYEITGDKARNVTEMFDLVHLKNQEFSELIILSLLETATCFVLGCLTLK